MTAPETPEEVRERVEILHTGRWYIAELDEPELAVQGESEWDAVESMVKRWREYTSENPDPVLCSDEDIGYDFDRSDLPDTPQSVQYD